MKNLKKIIALIIVVIQFVCFSPNIIKAKTVIPEGRPLRVAGLFYNFDDVFLSLIRKRFEDIQKESGDKVQFTFFDGKSNPVIQSENVEKVISGKYDFVVLNMIENRKDVIEGVFSKFNERNIPVISLSSDIPNTNAYNAHNKAYGVNSDAIGSGIAQGMLIRDIWNANKGIMDKNKDNILQYIMIQGRRNSIFTTERSRYSIGTLNNSKIATQELEAVPAEWDREVAKNTVSSLFLKYGNKIEAIISNNDSMAIGAIEALQKYGYNNGDKSKIIPVFGFDVTDEAKDLIKKGYMTGSIFQDPSVIADAIYTVGKNLLADRAPTYGTNYQISGKEITVPLEYTPYTASSN